MPLKPEASVLPSCCPPGNAGSRGGAGSAKGFYDLGVLGDNCSLPCSTNNCAGLVRCARLSLPVMFSLMSMHVTLLPSSVHGDSAWWPVAISRSSWLTMPRTIAMAGEPNRMSVLRPRFWSRLTRRAQSRGGSSSGLAGAAYQCSRGTHLLSWGSPR